MPPDSIPPDDPDAQLMLALRHGDESAFDALVLRWQSPIINFLNRSLNSYQAAEDLAQLVFIRLYRAAPSYEPRARFSTFIFQIARRLLINEFRRQQRKPLDHHDPADFASVPAAASNRHHREIEEAFESALDGLPENQRTAILLLKQQELSYQEIAEVMQASESAVKTWIFRARQFLKQALKDIV